VGWGLWLPNVKGYFLREFPSFFQCLFDGTDHIVQMDKNITVIRVPRIKMAQQFLFMDPFDLLGDGYGMPIIGIDSGNSQKYCGDALALVPNELFGQDLGFRIAPIGLHLTVLIDLEAGSTWPIDQV